MSSAQIILITGATSGIGRETALTLARAGHRVFATGRKADLLGELEQQAGGTQLETFLLDVNDADSIARAVAEVDARTDGYGLDVLVNNAGYAHMGPIELCTDDDLRGQFETNVFGLVRMCQRFAPKMRARGAGKIINVGSVVGFVALPMQGVYCATKHAVEAITAALRMELAAFGVHVTLVAPGTIKTGFEDTVTSTVSKYEAVASPYTPAVKRYQDVVASSYKSGVGPLCIAKTVARIVRKKRPGFHYVSPRYNWIVVVLYRWLPSVIMFSILRRAMGLTPKALGGR